MHLAHQAKYVDGNVLIFYWYSLQSYCVSNTKRKIFLENYLSSYDIFKVLQLAFSKRYKNFKLHSTAIMLSCTHLVMAERQLDIESITEYFRK